jgi:hypothetical protein
MPRKNSSIKAVRSFRLSLECVRQLNAHVGQIAHIKRFMAHSGEGISAGKSIVH